MQSRSPRPRGPTRASKGHGASAASRPDPASSLGAATGLGAVRDHQSDQWDTSTQDLQATFGRNFRAARLERGLKQSDVADATGITQQHLSLVEAGKQNITLRTMVLLGDIVGRTVSSLLLP